MTYRVIHQISTGPLVSLLEAGFTASAATYASGVLVTADLPEAKVARMVTVRDDGGPDDTVFSVRRHGINVYAPSKVDALNLALLAGAILRTTNTDVIASVDQIGSPVEIDDEAPFTVGSAVLSHFFFACRALVRGNNFPS